MKSSCIVHPANDPLILIRQWQKDFCDGNYVAAALMSYFEYWHNIRIGMKEQAIEANNIAERNKDPRTQDESLWQFHKAEEIEAGLMGIAKRDKIREALELLQAKGVVDVGNNPNPRYNFDRTKFFLFHPEVLNEWLRTVGPSAINRNSSDDKSQFEMRKIADRDAENRTPSAENRTPSAENRRAITEITSKITPIAVDDDDERARGDRRELDDPEAAAVLAAYDLAIEDKPSGFIKGKLLSLLDKVGPGPVLHGIAKAAEHDKRTFAYVAACAQNFADGVEKPVPRARGNGGLAVEAKRNYRPDEYADVILG